MPLRPGTMRASDADRDDTVERLRQAAAEGRLAADELDERVRRALVAVTYGDLSALVADLPSPGGVRRTLRVGRGPSFVTAAWTWRVARTHPGAIVLLIPFVVVVGTVLLAMAIVSLVLVAVAMTFGAQGCRGRRRRHTWASSS